MSVCFTICGDRQRGGSELCDNGMQIGCSNSCVPDPGYTCTGDIGTKSNCSLICGDFMKLGT
jgi:hypothetical protein